MIVTVLQSSPRQAEHGRARSGSPVLRPIIRLAGRPFNAFVLRFAGSRHFKLYGVVLHRGRRSGKQYATPVVVRPTADGFVGPAGFGRGS